MASKLAAIPASSYCPEEERKFEESLPEHLLKTTDLSPHQQFRQELEDDLSIKIAEFEGLFYEFRRNIQAISPDIVKKIDPVFDQLTQGAAVQFRHMMAEYIDSRHEEFKSEDYVESLERWHDRELAELRSEIYKLGNEISDRDELVEQVEQKFEEYKEKKKNEGGDSVKLIEELFRQHTAEIKRELFQAIPKPSEEEKKYPKLQDELVRFLKERKELQIGFKEQDKEAYYIKHRIGLFIDVCGNKEINNYSVKDVNRFAKMLQYLPANFGKLKGCKDKKAIDVIKENEKYASINDSVNWKRLTRKTIKDGYVGRVKSVMNRIFVYNDLDPKFQNVSIQIPKTGEESVIRRPLLAKDVNKLLVKSAKLRRPDDALLPLVALLTGARIGELVFLQSKDIVLGDGGYIIDLTTDIEINGESVPRNLKTLGSKRHIALHRVLDEIGFINWARGQGGFIFPHLHHSKIVDPADTASKRFQRLFKQLEINDHLKQVFHSLRHLYKDILRDAKIDGRVMNRQIGHSDGDYGEPLLRPSEIMDLSEVPLPKNIDLSPYRNFKFAALDRFDEVVFEQRISEKDDR